MFCTVPARYRTAIGQMPLTEKRCFVLKITYNQLSVTLSGPKTIFFLSTLSVACLCNMGLETAVNFTL